jgi:hypothetical protein
MDRTPSIHLNVLLKDRASKRMGVHGPLNISEVESGARED